ncbi:MAG: AAA family ATPase, partial [Planctomycetota bacterium]
MNCSDQASQLREMVRRDRDCRTIAVTSGKGGVGKSNVSLNLSLLLSAMGARVALVDADLGLANLDILLDVKIQHTLAHVIAGRRTVSEIIVELATGVQFVPGASGLAKAANLTDFTRYNLLGGLEKLEEDNDFVIVDTGAG